MLGFWIAVTVIGCLCVGLLFWIAMAVTGLLDIASQEARHAEDRCIRLGRVVNEFHSKIVFLNQTRENDRAKQTEAFIEAVSKLPPPILPKPKRKRPKPKPKPSKRSAKK